MALKIRLQRGGRTHTPHYRMVVAETSAPRDGKFVEVLGTYEPQAKRPEDELKLKLDRVDHWLSVGAKASDTCRTLINKVRRTGVGAVESGARSDAAAPVEAELEPVAVEAAPEPAAVAGEAAPAETEKKADTPADS